MILSASTYTNFNSSVMYIFIKRGNHLKPLNQKVPGAPLNSRVHSSLIQNYPHSTVIGMHWSHTYGKKVKIIAVKNQAMIIVQELHISILCDLQKVFPNQPKLYYTVGSHTHWHFCLIATHQFDRASISLRHVVKFNGIQQAKGYCSCFYTRKAMLLHHSY